MPIQISRSSFLAGATSIGALTACGSPTGVSSIPRGNALDFSADMQFVVNASQTQSAFITTASRTRLVTFDLIKRGAIFDPSISKLTDIQRASLPKLGSRSLMLMPAPSQCVQENDCEDSGNLPDTGLQVIGSTSTNTGDTVYQAVVQPYDPSNNYVVGSTSYNPGYTYFSKPTGCAKAVDQAAVAAASSALSILLPAGFALAETSSIVAILAAVGPAGWILLGIGLMGLLCSIADARAECGY